MYCSKIIKRGLINILEKKNRFSCATRDKFSIIMHKVRTCTCNPTNDSNFLFVNECYLTTTLQILLYKIIHTTKYYSRTDIRDVICSVGMHISRSLSLGVHVYINSPAL